MSKWALPAKRLLAAMPELDLPEVILPETVGNLRWFPPNHPAQQSGASRMACSRFVCTDLGERILVLEAIVAMDGSFLDLYRWGSNLNSHARVPARDALAAVRRAVQDHIRRTLAAPAPRW